MRLRQRRDFACIKEQGRRLVCGCLVANWRTLASDAPTQLGVITSRKLGGAVVRARARRLLREAFRLHQHDFNQPVALVLVARASIVHGSLARVENDLLSVLRQARLLKALT